MAYIKSIMLNQISRCLAKPYAMVTQSAAIVGKLCHRLPSEPQSTCVLWFYLLDRSGKSTTAALKTLEIMQREKIMGEYNEDWKRNFSPLDFASQKYRS